MLNAQDEREYALCAGKGCVWRILTVMEIEPRASTATAHVLDALVHVIARDGLEAASIDGLAAELDVTVAELTTHFPSKDELLQAAMDHIIAGFRRRFEAMEAATPSVRDRFEQMCMALACVTDDGREAAIVWLWFAAKSTSNDEFAKNYQGAWKRLEERLEKIVAEIYPELHAGSESALLLATLDGIALARASEPPRMPPNRAAYLVENALRRLDDRSLGAERYND